MNDRARPAAPPSAVDDGEGRTDRAIQTELNRIVLESVEPIALGLAILYALFAVAHQLLLPSAQATPLMLSAAGSAAVLAALRLGLRRWRPSAGMAHPLGAVVAAVVLANSLLHLHLTGEPRQTTNLLLLILGAGVVFLDAGWFAAVVAASFLGWIAVLTTSTPSPEWIHFGFALAGATVLASAVLIVRIRTFRRIEELRLRDRVRQLELESALARTEEARLSEQEAREALEEAVQEVQESKERFRRLANASYEGVVIQQDGAIVDANPRAARLFGLRPGNLVGRSLGDLVPEGDRARVTGFLRGAVEPDREALLTEGLRESGEAFSLELRRATATHRGREAAVGILRDVTEQVEVERMLRKAVAEAQASSRAKSNFLANMSHELRTPLNSVIGFANILRKKAEESLGERELGYLDRIVSNGKLLLELIGDVLDLSKIEAGQMVPSPESVEIADVVQETIRTVEIQAERKGLDLRTVVPDDLEAVETDPYRLRQILVNLVGNAVKFTEQGYVEVRVEANDEGRPARIRVEDTGPGIPEDRRANIFDAFQQAETSTARRYGGTGLGLTIARSMAQLLGFGMTVHSEVGEGTTFTVFLDGDRTSSGPARREGGDAPSSRDDGEGRGEPPPGGGPQGAGRGRDS